MFPFGFLPTEEVGAFEFEVIDDTFSLWFRVIKVPNRGLTPMNNVIDHHQLPPIRVVHTTASPMCINGINAAGYGLATHDRELDTSGKGLEPLI